MQKEFKIAELDGQVGCFDTLTPLYAAFHEDDKTFSFMWTEYTDDFMAFYQSYLDNQRRYGGSHGVLAQAGQTPPANAYTISCVPWVSFKHFSVHSYENKPYYLPSVEAGRFYEKDCRIMMPLSITLKPFRPFHKRNNAEGQSDCHRILGKRNVFKFKRIGQERDVDDNGRAQKGSRHGQPQPRIMMF